MALSHLNPLDPGKYPSGTFNRPPNKTPIDNPDPRIGVDLGGWEDRVNNVMYFKIIDAENTESQVSINQEAANTLNVNAKNVKRPDTKTSYFSVNTGSDNRDTDWDLMFDVYNDDANPDTKYTGQWKFTKSKGEDDKAY